ncbi:MAG TPA: hypothetical protein VFF73_14465 [Planctomycetota bacterium]|nr:hypothetical protein [Planctomycetota bacterium]
MNRAIESAINHYVAMAVDEERQAVVGWLHMKADKPGPNPVEAILLRDIAQKIANGEHVR